MKCGKRIGAALCAFLIVGCQPYQSEIQTSHELQPAAIDQNIDQNKVQLDYSVLADQGQAPVAVQIPGVNGKPSRESVKLKRGSRLLAVVDNECFARRNANGMAAEVSALRTHELEQQAYAFTLKNETDLEALEKRASEDECVVQVANDMDVYAIGSMNDPSFSKQWHMQAIEAATGYDTFFDSNSGIKQDVVIAIVDTGVNYNHTDLAANMWKSSAGIYGRDFINNDNDPMDDFGHGTHCAGLAAAVSNNGIGVSGVAGLHAKIMAVKVLGRDGSGSSESIVNGINYAAQSGANVISLSLGAKGQNAAFQTAVANAVAKGATVVIAAGNDNASMSSSNWYSPASYAAGINGALSIGALAQGNSRSTFSNYSPQYVDLGSPGTDILSTLMNGSYGPMSGTSMATPITAGAAGLVVGLLKSRGVNSTPALVEQLLKEGAVKDPNLTSYFASGNRLNLRTLASTINSKYPGSSPMPNPTPTPTPNPTPTPTPNPTPSECGSMGAVACQVFKSINQMRAQNGVPALQATSSCTGLAQDHTDDMAKNMFLSHTSPTFGEFAARAAAHGVTGTAGENIARGGNSPLAIVNLWMGSAPHKANLLNRNYKSTGVGVSKDAQGRYYYLQCFSSN